MRVELRNQPAQRSNAIALANAQHSHIQAIRPRLHCRNRISQSATGIVVAMKFDANARVAFMAEPHELLYLPRRGNTDGIRQPDSLHTRLDNGIENTQQINQVAAESIFSGEANVATSSANTPDQRHCIRYHLLDAPPMTVCPQFCRRAI